MKKHKGFTVIELMVVIVVIAILASIVIMAYTFVRDDGLDSKIRAVVKTAGDALQLAESQNELPSAHGYFSNTGGVDSLVPKYLKPGYRDGIKSKNVSDPKYIFRWYPCKSGAGSTVNGFAVFTSLNNPTDDDKAQFHKVRTVCRIDPSHAPDTGVFRYNYAQVF